MTKTAFIFPGQGSQAVGMGKALYDTFEEARLVFEEVDDVLGQKLSQLIFNGPMEDLTLTANTQPALMAMSMAVWRVIEKQGTSISEGVNSAAGHSLGEYSALGAAGTFSLAETARLLRTRGAAMQEAVPVGEGAMAALIGATLESAQALIDDTSEDGIAEIANDNAPGQVVISGSTARIEEACAKARDHKIKMAKLLPVSAPFHCTLMAPAADKMSEAFEKTAPQSPAFPVVANVTAMPVNDAAEVPGLLVKQVTGRVRWVETIQYMRSQGVERFVEIGAGKVLSGLVKRIDKEAEAVNIQEPEDIEAFLT